MSKTKDTFEDNTVRVNAVMGWRLAAVVGVPTVAVIFAAGGLFFEIKSLGKSFNSVSDEQREHRKSLQDHAERLVKLETWRDGPNRRSDGNGGGPFRDAMAPSEIPR